VIIGGHPDVYRDRFSPPYERESLVFHGIEDYMQLVQQQVEGRLSLWSDAECSAWRPKPPMDIAPWARARIWLTREMGCEPGPYDPDRTPWVHIIFQAFQDKKVDGIVAVMSAQGGKSLTAQICIGWVIDNDPSNIIYFIDTVENAIWVSRRRIQKMLDAQKSLAGKIDPPHKRKALDIGFMGGSLVLGGASSASQLANKSAPRVIRDEIGKWKDALGAEAGALENAAQRTKGQIWSVLFDISTPVMEGDPILKRYELSDKNKWFVPCPLCGHYQELIWEQVKYAKDENGKGDPMTVREPGNAWYECIGCKEKIYEKHKRWMNRHGQGVREGEKVVLLDDLPFDSAKALRSGSAPDDGAERLSFCFTENSWEVGRRYNLWAIELESGKRVFYKKVGNPKFNSIVGLHISRIYSPFNSWGELAKEWLEIGRDSSKRQAFVNSTLAQPYHQKATKSNIDEIAAHITKAVKPKVASQGYDIIICTADYHGARFGVRFVTLAINSISHDIDMIDYGELGNLDDFLDRIRSPYDLADGGQGVADLSGVDSGYQAGKVYDFCRLVPRCFPTKGFAGRAGKPISLSEIDEYKNAKGKRIEKPKKVDRSAFRLFQMDVKVWKDNLFDMLNETSRDGGFVVRFHGDTGEDFIESMCSEKRVERTDRVGRISTEWVVDKHEKNHYWDCFVAGLALASWWIPQVVDARLRAMKRKRRTGRMRR
jgi:phage terminase large subunit GpA-like protein